MLARKYRFHARGGVRYVYKRGCGIRGRDLSLTFMPNTRGRTRFAVVVSKKVIKSAVKRNKIRRRIYSSIGSLLSKLTGPFDVIFTVYNPSVLTMRYDALNEVVESLTKNAKII